MVTIIFRHFLIWCRVHNWIKDYKLPCLSGCISLKAILGLHKLYLLFLCTNNFLEKHICKLDILLWGRIYRGGKSWAGCLSDISSICRRSLLWWAKHSRLCPPPKEFVYETPLNPSIWQFLTDLLDYIPFITIFRTLLVKSLSIILSVLRTNPYTQPDTHKKKTNPQCSGHVVPGEN